MRRGALWYEPDVSLTPVGRSVKGAGCEAGGRCAVLHYAWKCAGEGIGEVLTPLPPCPRCYILIAKPPLSASTEKVYARYDALEHVEHPDLDRVIRGLEQSDIREVAAGMGNVLEQVMIPEYPVIGEIKEMMLETGALGAMMSGSGPTVFGIYKTRGAAKEGARKIKSRGLARQVYVTNVHNVRRKP